jgi:hypothetical protein
MRKSTGSLQMAQSGNRDLIIKAPPPWNIWLHKLCQTNCGYVCTSMAGNKLVSCSAVLRTCHSGRNCTLGGPEISYSISGRNGTPSHSYAARGWRDWVSVSGNESTSLIGVCLQSQNKKARTTIPTESYPIRNNLRRDILITSRRALEASFDNII